MVVAAQEGRTTSTHRTEVVPVQLENFPGDADLLSIVKVFDNYQVVVRTSEWENVGVGAYIVPDSVVPDTPQFEFLGNSKRIKVKRFRGVWSMGMLVPAPDGSQIGDDVAEQLNITRWEPKEQVTMFGSAMSSPKTFSSYIPVYDVDTWHKYGSLFTNGEEVVVTEKIHGANARFMYSAEDDKMFCGSKTQWKKDEIQESEDGKNNKEDLWWKCLRRNPWIEDFCRTFPNYFLYGEVFGNVQNLKYGAGKNDVFFRAFDVYSDKEMRFLSWNELTSITWNQGEDVLVNDERWVPVLYHGKYDTELMKEMSSGASMIPTANHMREGVVLTPVNERYSNEIGRVKLKIVSNKYLEKAK